MVIYMLRNLREYIAPDELKITITMDKVNILNYDRLRDITDKEISFSKNNKKVKVVGKDLKLNKLLDQEVLIIGNIMKVEIDNG